MNWSRLFPFQALQKGLEYQKEQRVVNLTEKEPGLYQAEVKGQSQYSVEIQKRNNDIVRTSCTCSCARNGEYCKHMAAVLWALDVGQKVNQTFEKQKSRILHIFPENHSSEYQYFDMGYIFRNYITDEATVKKAQEIIRSGKLTDIKIEAKYVSADQIRQVDELAIEANACIEMRGGQNRVSVVFTRKRVRYCTCNIFGCPRFYYDYEEWENPADKKKPCAHELALIYLVKLYLDKHDMGDSTDRRAVGVLEAFEKLDRLQPDELEEGKEQKVTLEPRLIRSDGVLYLSFRIGTDKLYVVKNLKTLVEAADIEGVMKLGKGEFLYFELSSFDEKSQRLYSLIRRIVQDEKRRAKRMMQAVGVNPIGSLRSEVELGGVLMDDFFDLMQGQTVNFIDKDGSNRNEIKPILFQEKNLNVRLTIRKDEDERKILHGIKVEGKIPVIVEGDQYGYFLDDTGLNRMSRDGLQVLKILRTEAAGSGVDIQLHIGRKHLPEFYYTVLPSLRRYVEIKEEDTEKLEKIIPPEASYVFYLDASDKRLTCRPVVTYGDQQCPLAGPFEDQSKIEVFRDLNGERKIRNAIYRYFPESNMTSGLYSCTADEDAVYKVLTEGVQSLLRLGEVHGSNEFKALRIHKRISIKVGVSLESDLMNLEIHSDDISNEELLELLRSYQKKRKYHRLYSGDFVEISEDVAELSAMMESMRLSPREFVKGNMHVPAYRALYLDKMLEQCEEVYAQRDQKFRQLVKAFKTVKDSDFEVPESLKSTLRGYQAYGYKWLRTLDASGFGGILADDMGLGKTLQMIAVLLAAKEEGAKGVSLVVCPASLVYNWVEEINRFAPALAVKAVVGLQPERQRVIERYQEADVLVTSYDLLKRDIAYYEDITFQYQVIDEAQYIKTHTTAAAKAVKVVKSRTRFALTGTPIENRLSELWSIFDYLMPGFLYGYEVFRKNLESPITKKHDEDCIQRLKKMVAPFILRRLKSDVLKDLPDKIEEVRYARFEPAQRRLYDGQVVHMRNMLNAQGGEEIRKKKIQILAELMRIRQICCDPSLVFEDYNEESAKKEACIDLIKSAIEGEHRILVFSQFTSMLELLEQELQREELPYYKITGATPKQERIELVRKFNEDSTPVFLISLKAGGTGLNLTGADVVIHYDPWWNMAAQNQATDRAHRIGQTKIVTVYKLIVKDTIEEKIQQMQEAKKDLANEILSGEMGNLASLSKEELLELLS